MLTLTAMRCHVTAARASISALGRGGATRLSMCLVMKEVSSSAASKAGCWHRCFRKATFVDSPLTCNAFIQVPVLSCPDLLLALTPAVH